MGEGGIVNTALAITLVGCMYLVTLNDILTF